MFRPSSSEYPVESLRNPPGTSTTSKQQQQQHESSLYSSAQIDLQQRPNRSSSQRDTQVKVYIFYSDLVWRMQLMIIKG